MHYYLWAAFAIIWDNKLDTLNIKVWATAWKSKNIHGRYEEEMNDRQSNGKKDETL